MLMMLIYWVEEHNIMKKNTEALVVASKEIGLDLNAEKSILSFPEIRLEGKSLYIRLIIGPLKW